MLSLNANPKHKATAYKIPQTTAQLVRLMIKNNNKAIPQPFTVFSFLNLLKLKVSYKGK